MTTIIIIALLVAIFILVIKSRYFKSKNVEALQSSSVTPEKDNDKQTEEPQSKVVKRDAKGRYAKKESKL